MITFPEFVKQAGHVGVWGRHKSLPRSVSCFRVVLGARTTVADLTCSLFREAAATKAEPEVLDMIADAFEDARLEERGEAGSVLYFPEILGDESVEG